MSDNNAWQFLIPFKGPDFSGPFQLNLLARWNNIFVMDNHKMALWCWAQTIDSPTLSSSGNYLFHLDAHYDTDPKDEVLDQYKNWQAISQASAYDFSTKSQIRWDNYLSFAHKNFPGIWKKSFGCTHEIGLKFHFDVEFKIWDLLRDLDRTFYQSSYPWIVNIDLDFFFARQFKKTPMFHELWMKRFWEIISMNYADGRIKVLTIALSPECCGGWDNSLQILRQIQIEGVSPFPL